MQRFISTAAHLGEKHSVSKR